MAWEAARRRIGRPDFRFHDLRHEVGRRVAREDGVGAVMNVLGHADISTSMRYSHYDDEMKRLSLEKIGRRKSRIIPGVDFKPGVK